MECRAYGICLDSQSRGYLGKDRKVSSAAGGNLSRMHKTQETAKESRLNFMYSHLRNRTLAFIRITNNSSGKDEIAFEDFIRAEPGILECHIVSGEDTHMLKIRTDAPASLGTFSQGCASTPVLRVR